MDSPDKNSSSSRLAQPSSIPQGLEENDQSHQEMNFNLEYPRKPTSPNISSASKAIPPEKKILAERNESAESNIPSARCSETSCPDREQPRKTPVSNSKSTSKNLGTDGSSETSSCGKPSRIDKFADDGENAPPVDSPLRPYDPSTNFLSPRPQFLRFNPNRRNEVFLRIENGSNAFDSMEDVAEEGGSLRSVGHSQEFPFQQEDEELDFDEESEEEFEIEEKSWGLRAALRFLLLLVVLVLCTSYISSMNSPTPSPLLQACLDLKDLSHKIQNHFSDVVQSLEGGSRFLDEKAAPLGSNLTVIQARGNRGIEPVEMAGVLEEDGESEDTFVETEEVFMYIAEDTGLQEKVAMEIDGVVKEDGEIEDDLVGTEEVSRYVVEDIALQGKGNMEVVGVVKENGESEDALVGTEEVSEYIVEDIVLQEKITMEMVGFVKEDGESEDAFVETEEVSENIVKDIVLQEKGAVDMMVRVIIEDGENEDAWETEEVSEYTVEGIVLQEKVTMEMVRIVKEDGESKDALVETEEVSDIVGEIALQEKINVGKVESVGILEKSKKADMGGESLVKMVAGSEASHEDSFDDEVQRSAFIFEEENPELIGTQILVKAILFIGASVSVIVASLLLGSGIRRKRGVTKDPSLADDKPSAESVAVNNPISLPPQEREEHSNSGNSFVNSLPLIDTMKEDSPSSYQSQKAPTVELLGEFVVEPEISRKNDVKQVKSWSLPQEKNGLQRTVDSAMSSYGSLAAEKKVSRKEFRKTELANEDEEGRKAAATATPVRRSARIRNRAVVSP